MNRPNPRRAEAAKLNWSVSCPHCGARPGAPCRSRNGMAYGAPTAHYARRTLARGLDADSRRRRGKLAPKLDAILAARRELLTVPCPHCKARKGELCRNPSGESYSKDNFHAARREGLAALAGR